MPTINNAIVFTQEALGKIQDAKAKPGYSHKSWESDDLLSVRREIRDFYRREQRLICAYCREVISARAAASAPIEHIAPKSAYLQFMFEPKNLCVVCGDCNEYKSNREVLAEPVMRRENKRDYPLDSDNYRSYHPHFDDYQAHILKVEHLYFQRSPKGAYTIYACNLNRFVEMFGMSQEMLDNMQIMARQERFHNEA